MATSLLSDICGGCPVKEIEGKTAIITGGAGGIGAASALALGREGAKVLVADLNLEGADRVVEEINANGGQAASVRVDVTRSGEVNDMVDAALNRFGSVDILLNSQGVGRRKLVVDLTEEDWDWVVGIHLKGTFLTCQAAVKQMIPKRYGRIINLASEAGIRHSPEHAPYGAAKAAIINFTKTLALEVAPYLITVNAIAPGRTETPMWAHTRSPEEIEAERSVGKLGKPEDVAGIVLFLVSDWGKIITGQTIWRSIFLGMKPEDTYQFPY
jgi:NAD(P)-dependent dehydrogenase (short-subunit alcohol dehydrogenase family)